MHVRARRGWGWGDTYAQVRTVGAHVGCGEYGVHVAWSAEKIMLARVVRRAELSRWRRECVRAGASPRPW